jgi:sugar transferase (PEP-CTERM/EpsH1 system associated)
MILPSLIAAGMETVTARLAMQLASTGHTVGVTCLLDEGPLASDLRAAGHRVAVVPAPGLRTNVMPVQLAAWLRREQPDVVHAHSGTWLKAARAARLAGVRRVVFTEHGLNDVEPWYNAILKRCGGWMTDCVVAVSHPLRQYLVEHVRIPESKVVVIPNGVDTLRFRPGPSRGELRARLGLGNAAVIGHVARLAPVKNQPLLVDALGRVRERAPNAHLVIVGDGPERDALRAHIRARGLEASVHLAGEARDVPSILREFDVFALPSKAEGTSMSVLEAMASGVPIVASAVGGTPDLLDHGRCGVLVAPNDVDALADALADLLLAPERRRDLAAAARARVMSEFDEAVVAKRYEGLYRGVDPLGIPAESPTATAVCAG